MLAEHRLEDVGGLSLGPVLPALQAYPLLSAAVGDLGLAHHRHIVLGGAGDDAGLAARAGIGVDGHAPAVVRVLDPRIHARVARVVRRFASQLHLARGGQPDHFHDLAVVVVEGRLRNGEGLAGAGLCQGYLHREERQPARGRFGIRAEEPYRVGASVEHDVAQMSRAEIARPRVRARIVVTQTHGHRHRSRMKGGRRPRRQLHAAVRRGELHHIAPRQVELARGLGGHLDPAAPRHLSHGVRRFLQPGLVGTPTVVETERWIHDEGVRAVTLELGCLDAQAARVELPRAPARRCGGPPRAAPTEGLLPEIDGILAPAVFARHALPLLPHVVLEARPLERPLALLGAEGLASDGEQDVSGGPALHRLALDGHGPHGRLHEPDDAFASHVVTP